MLFGCLYSAWILLVGVVLVLAQPPTDVPRQYVARADVLNRLNAGDFSVVDRSEKKIYYQVEPRGSNRLMWLEVIKHPRKVKTARLAFKPYTETYRGNFSILNETSKRWTSGTIEQTGRFRQFAFVIRWNGHQINMTDKSNGAATPFRDESNELLADHRLQLSRDMWIKKYDVKVYTNKYPEEIYLLALAVYDREIVRHGKKR